MNSEERQAVEERTAELALALQERAQETFSAECKRTDQARNMAVLSSALVRAGVRITYEFCPREMLPSAIQGLVLQIQAELMEEIGPPPGEEAGRVNGAGLVAGQVEDEVGEPQQDPE